MPSVDDVDGDENDNNNSFDFRGSENENGQNFDCERQTKEKRKINRHFGFRSQIAFHSIQFTCKFWYTVFLCRISNIIITQNSSHIFLFRLTFSVSVECTFDFVWIFPFMWSRFPDPDLFTSVANANAHTLTHNYELEKLTAVSVCLLLMLNTQTCDVPCCFVRCVIRNPYTRKCRRTSTFVRTGQWFSIAFCSFYFSHKEETRKTVQLLHLRVAYFVGCTTMNGCVWQLTCAHRTSRHAMPILIHCGNAFDI